MSVARLRWLPATRLPRAPVWIWALVGLWIAVVLAGVVVELSTGEHVELCALKHFTGVPCATCGSTRAVLSLVGGNFVGALAWNPGVVLALLTTLTVLIARVASARAPRLELSARGRRWLWIAISSLVVANWAYVIAAGR